MYMIWYDISYQDIYIIIWYCDTFISTFYLYAICINLFRKLKKPAASTEGPKIFFLYICISEYFHYGSVGS